MAHQVEGVDSSHRHALLLEQAGDRSCPFAFDLPVPSVRSHECFESASHRGSASVLPSSSLLTSVRLPPRLNIRIGSDSEGCAASCNTRSAAMSRHWRRFIKPQSGQALPLPALLGTLQAARKAGGPPNHACRSRQHCCPPRTKATSCSWIWPGARPRPRHLRAARRHGPGRQRLDHIPNSEPPRVRIISPTTPSTRPTRGTAEEVNIIGRIRWYAREI